MFTNVEHRYLHHANKTLNWLPMDTAELYIKNLKHRYHELEKYGWINATITYKFNKYGFRSDEFVQEPNIMFLGCSHTCGIGIPYQYSWTNIVSDAIGLKNFNMGIGASSNDTASRLALNWIPQLKPKIVIYLSPSKWRFESYINGQLVDHGPWCDQNNPVWVDWLSNPANVELNYLKNTGSIERICQQHSVKLLHMEWESLYGNDITGIDLARDLGHCGIISNQRIAQYILSKL